MIEKKYQDVEKVVYSPPKVPDKIKNILERQSKAKTLKAYIEGHIKILRENKNFEYAKLFEETIKNFEKIKQSNKKQKEEVIIEIEGWKGKDEIDINKLFTNDFIVKEHRKDKDTGNVITSTHLIPHENVNRILNFIKKWKVGEKHKCYDFTELFGFKDWKDVWKYRTSVYFPKYYYPIKCLEYLKIINYSGRGVVTRLK